MHQCSCRPGDIARYRKKISGPLLDRIDIQIHVPRLQYQELKSDKKEESSAVIRQRVVAAREIQRQRLKGTHLYCNASMGRREVKDLLVPMTRKRKPCWSGTLWLWGSAPAATTGLSRWHGPLRIWRKVP